MKTGKYFFTSILLSMIPAILLCLAIILISSRSGVDLSNMFKNLNPVISANIITNFDKNFNTILHVSTLLFLILLQILGFLMNKLFKSTFFDFRRQMKIFILLLTITFASIQIYAQMNVFISEYRTYNGKTIAQKKMLLFGNIYKFSKICKIFHKGSHKAVLFSDIDAKTPSIEYDIIARLGYNLFPLDILNITDTDPDCIIVFSKTEPDISENLLQKFGDWKIFGKYYAISKVKEP